MAEVTANNVWFLSVALVLIPLTEPAVTAFGSLKPSDPSFAREWDNITLKWNYTIDGSIGQAQFFNATDDVVIAAKFGDGDVNVASDYQERFRVDISNTFSQLTILSVQRSDHGGYKFILTTSKLAAISDEVELEVQYPAVITHISGNQTVNETDVVALICLSEGMPAPSISRTRVSDNSSVSFPLIITGKQDEGGYRCTADNDIGNPASHVIYIIVENCAERQLKSVEKWDPNMARDYQGWNLKLEPPAKAYYTPLFPSRDSLARTGMSLVAISIPLSSYRTLED